MKINIKNCNCIKEAGLKIEPHELNIKYAVNGTGKSTIAKAISYKTGNESKLELLKPYGSNESPYVDIDSIQSVKIYNDEYVGNYVFTDGNILKDPFKIFLSSKECENLSKQIDDKTRSLRDMFTTNAEYRTLKEKVEKLTGKIGFSNGKIKATGGVGEFLKGYGCGFDKRNELSNYKTYYSGEYADISGWAKWRTDGVKYIKDNLCPFCMDTLRAEIKTENDSIKKVFKNSSLQTASEIFDCLDEIEKVQLMNSDEVECIKSLSGDENKIYELTAKMNGLMTEATYLLDKFNSIFSFKPLGVDREAIDEMNNNLEGMKIDKSYIKEFFSTDNVYKIADYINGYLDSLIVKSGELKGLFNRYDKRLKDLISNQKGDVNQFLAMAGFPYEFEIEPETEGKAFIYLKPVKLDLKVENPAGHLSYGEKNAFALVMFMYEAIKENPDLIILDDPVTSFDNSKKFAVISRMFKNKENGFSERTVLMFTHDMQPVIDYVHNQILKKNHGNTKVNAAFLENDEGIINEIDIKKDDLRNVVTLTKDIVENDGYRMSTRIVNLRKYVELTNNSFETDNVYNVLSNVIHDREKPLYKDESDMPDENVKEGMKVINKYFHDISDYESLRSSVTDDEINRVIQNGDNYEKILALRLYFERYENKFSKLKKNSPHVSKYMNESNHIENDYVFQLDPKKYYSIPQGYLQILIDAM